MGLFTHHVVDIGTASVHVVECGEPARQPVVFVHGWPQSWQTWRPMMAIAGSSVRAIALDLPGIGGSLGDPTDGSKHRIAELLHDVAAQLRLDDFVLVGHDIGGMIAYSYLHLYDDVQRAVIMDVAIPGVDPWDDVLRNPYLWHFALHAVGELPEVLVRGRQAPYFDYFYDVLARDPAAISSNARDAYVAAYGTNAALTAGFNWYRAFAEDAERNRSLKPVDVPVLYLRGEHEHGDIDTYAAGLRNAGIAELDHESIPGAGHFTQEEDPEATWRAIARFIGVPAPDEPSFGRQRAS